MKFSRVEKNYNEGYANNFQKMHDHRKPQNRLLQICESEDNFKELQGLDWGFVEGLHEYHGSLNLSQQIAFLYLVAERISNDFDRNCKSCSMDGGVAMMTDIPVLLAKIDALDSEMHLHKAE